MIIEDYMYGPSFQRLHLYLRKSLNLVLSYLKIQVLLVDDYGNQGNFNFWVSSIVIYVKHI